MGKNTSTAVAPVETASETLHGEIEVTFRLVTASFAPGLLRERKYLGVPS